MEINILDLCNRFGAGCVLGDHAPLGVLNRLRIADTMTKAYVERENAEMMAEWEHNNPQKARLLHRGLRLAIDLKLIEAE